jgi:sorbitol-specific phosphotransferase system component IIC
LICLLIFALPGAFTLGSIFNEAATPCSVTKMVSQCDRKE